MEAQSDCGGERRLVANGALFAKTTLRASQPLLGCKYDRRSDP
jgi:hypothetical protein